MLLAIDIGNTNTVLGLFEGHTLRTHMRWETRAGRTADEIAAMAASLFQLAGLRFADVTAAVVCSVVPPAVFAVERWLAGHVDRTPFIVGPGVKTGMPVLTDNPREVGADRIVNAVAAFERAKGGVVVVDFGTATTLDLVSPRGEYLGGIIAPGLMVSADALYHATAKLPRVEIARPRTAVGKNTVASIQSGLVFGYAGMVDALVARVRAEVDFPVKVIATGGLAIMMAKETTSIEECDDLLTLEGLRLIHGRNVAP